MQIESEAAEIGVRAAALGHFREIVADVQNASQELVGATQCDRFEQTALMYSFLRRFPEVHDVSLYASCRA